MAQQAGDGRSTRGPGNQGGEQPRSPEGGRGARADDRRLARLAAEELPGLIARFETSGLGELEIRRDGWKVRFRRSALSAEAGRAASGASHEGGGAAAGGRARRGDGGHGRPSTSREVDVSSSLPRDPAAPGPSAAFGNGSHGEALRPVGPGRAADPASRRRQAARAPAVGYFAPLEGMSPGHQVRAGDLLGHVDVLGVRQEVVAPIDGVVVRVLAEAGQAVEYGEDLVRVDALGSRPAPDGDEGERGDAVAGSEEAVAGSGDAGAGSGDGGAATSGGEA
jgi:biotin carboxyl carrier protein